MQDINESKIISFLTSRLKEKRFNHSIGVMNMAVKLADIHGVNREDARIAGLLHDCAKNMTNDELLQYCKDNDIEVDDVRRTSPGILHAEVGADIAKKRFHVSDEIEEAILFHTLANSKMTNLDKIIYISDLIEEGRELEGLDEIRNTAYENLDKALVMSLEYCIANVKEMGKIIHKQSIDALEAARNRCK